MLKIFQPDIFSSSKPHFCQIALGNVQMVLEVIDRFYSQNFCCSQGLEPKVRLEQFGGNEINSNNFRLHSADGVYLLKRLPLSADAVLIERQLALVEWLRGVHGLRLPVLLRTEDGNRLGKDEKSLWCLFEFLEGDFFAGGLDQLVETGREIGRLQSALRICPPELMPPQRWEYFTTDDASVYKVTIDRRSEWPRLFGADLATLLKDEDESVRQSWQVLAGASTQLSKLEPMACHCDLHPHNLLMRGSTLAGFIDFDSFVKMPAEAALGFATFKLLRQHAVTVSQGVQNKDEIRKAMHAFLAAMAESTEAATLRPELLRDMALAEVFRRILVIFRLNLREANPAWNHVLPIHLAGLHELRVIFG
jgi:Ser/Thr protein kinase RdoA (MazF antagonist)